MHNTTQIPNDAQVTLSYLVMLGCVASKLGYLPSGARVREIWVTGRVSLAAGGVGIVAAAVLGALGLGRLMGTWSTLISMEVRYLSSGALFLRCRAPTPTVPCTL